MVNFTITEFIRNFVEPTNKNELDMETKNIASDILKNNNLDYIELILPSFESQKSEKYFELVYLLFIYSRFPFLLCILNFRISHGFINL